MKKCNLLVSAMLTLALTACGGAGEQGPEGKQGPQGLKGDAGSDGQPGSDGEGCYVVKKDADHGIVICPADGSSYVIYSPENLPKANGLPNGNGGYLFCNAGYFGAECEACACEHGTCNDGLNGNGECSCAKGYTGKDCSVLALGYMADTTGKAYKTVVIGTKEWMAENMATDSATDGSSVTCYANTDADPDFVEHYGCLYNFEEAQKVCPAGWHLPISTEFSELRNAAGDNNQSKSDNLRSKSWNGNDSLGFNALPAGLFNGNTYSDQYVETRFWSATKQSGSDKPLLMRITESSASDAIDNLNSSAYSVRCIKD